MVRKLSGFLGCSFFVLIASVSSAADLQRIPAKSSPEPLDQLEEAAEVEGARIVVGVSSLFGDGHRSGLGEDAQPLSVDLPKDWNEGSVCGRLMSADALYEGRVEYDLDSAEAGAPVILEFASAYIDKLSALSPEGLAVAVTRGPCAQPPVVHALAHWRLEDPAAATGVAVFVNSQGASDVFVEISAGQEHLEMTCSRGASGAEVAFDHICRADLDEIPAGTELHLLIDRLTYGAVERPVKLSLHMMEPL